jgi:hypothetical protein
MANIGLRIHLAQIGCEARAGTEREGEARLGAPNGDGRHGWDFKGGRLSSLAASV